MKRFIVRDKRSGQYKVKSRGFASNMWTDDKAKAQLFKTTGAIKNSLYGYNTNRKKSKLSGKMIHCNPIILPDWVEIIPVNLVIEE